MSGRIIFKTTNEVFILPFLIIDDNKKADVAPQHFESVWKNLLSCYSGEFALEIENAMQPSSEKILFFPDRTLKPRACFATDNKVEKVFLNQSDIDICEIPKAEEEWKITLNVIPKRNITQLDKILHINFETENGNNSLMMDTESAFVDNFEASFESELSEVGQEQLKIVQNYVKKSYSCYSSNNFYAPISSLIQSSGFGKSKICADLLLTHPGISAVFRGQNSNINLYTFPTEPKWVKPMIEFIYHNTVDELPLELKDMFTSDASKYSIGCMLLAMRTLIVAYYKMYGDLRNKSFSREAAIKVIGEKFRSGSIEWGDEGAELLFEKKKIIFFTLLSQIMNLLKYNSHANSMIEGLGISNTIVKELMPESGTQFPFLFIFDEASVFDRYLDKTSRLSGLHVLRRALHLLNIKTPLYFLLIGTNSDAIDFSPALNVDSIRYPMRANLLPSFWLTRNTGIFSEKLKLHEIEITPSFLLNRNVMKLFFTMGRPLWTSYVIDLALDLAVTKISNGNHASMETLISCLLCRADLNVVPSSILCRNLVKSHIAVVYSISTDSKSMKIGYPSEPPLALAARKSFEDKSTRESAFLALFEFLQRRAIDKGRVSETILEHFILFAIDDVARNQEYLTEFQNKYYLLSEVSGLENKNIDKVLSCQTFLLDIDWNSTTEIKVSESLEDDESRGNVIHEDYHVINVKYFLKSLLTESVYSEIVNYLPDNGPLMNGFINTSHFVNLESDSTKLLSKFFKTGSKAFKVDRSLLKMGLIRGCGFVLPPGTFGLDFIVPVLLNSENPTKRPRYSFIGVQVKTTAGYFYQEVAKTALPFLVERCLNHPECLKGNHHAGCMSEEEYDEIVANQLTLILCADRDDVANRIKGSFYSVKPQASSTFKRSRTEKENDEKEAENSSDYEDAIESDEELIKFEDLEEGDEDIFDIKDLSRSLSTTQLSQLSSVTEKKLKELKRLKEIEDSREVVEKLWPKSFKKFEEEAPVYFSFPSFGKIGIEHKPDLLVKTIINDTISVQNLIWDQSHGKSHKLTCIISNDMTNFGHLVTEKTIDICKKIVVYTIHLFDDVDDFNLPAVIDSALFTEFSKFYQFNPDLRLARGEEPFTNEDFMAMSQYTKKQLQNSINAAIARKIA